jgi:hypothetical protein
MLEEYLNASTVGTDVVFSRDEKLNSCQVIVYIAQRYGVEISGGRVVGQLGGETVVGKLKS